MIRLPSLFLLLMVAVSSHAAPTIVDIEGDPDGVALVRAGTSLTPLPLTGLQAGDEIRILKPGTLVTIRSAGETVRVDKALSPYRVAVVGQPTVLDNAIAMFTEAYRSLVGSTDKVTGLFGRGNTEQQPVFVCARPDENPIPAGVAPVVFWDNGHGPFQLTLRSEQADETPVVERVNAIGSPAPFSPTSLPTGAYRITIRDSRGPAAFPLKFEVVSARELPEEARVLMSSKLPPRAKYRLMALALMAELAGDGGYWRYAVAVFAARANDEELLSKVLAQSCRGLR